MHPIRNSFVSGIRSLFPNVKRKLKSSVAELVIQNLMKLNMLERDR